MAIATVERARTDDTESRRKAMLAESDALLGDLELLRLDDRSEAPAELREAIHALQIRLGRRHPPVPPSTLDAAHELVFAVQQRLMAANPNFPRPNRHVGRPGGQPVVTVVRDDRRWKVLALPAPSGSSDDDEWLSLVDSTVERGWDRWCYAQHQAVRAARERFKAQLAVAVAAAAWANYWDLLQEAERIKERLAARRGSARRPGGSLSARGS
jgi:hypothetical protein